jgi:glycine oxidase
MKVAIVGAGILGRLVAWHLYRSFEVHVFEQEAFNAKKSCSFAAGAMISPFGELGVLGNQWLIKAQAALTWWPIILKSLAQPVYYRHSGTKVVASLEDAHLLEQWIALIKRHFSSFSPLVKKGKQITCYVQEEAHLNPRELLRSLAHHLITHGVKWHTKAVEEVKPYVLKVENTTCHFDWIIDCRGMGAKGIVPGLRAIRGEMLLLEAANIDLHCAVRSLHPLYSCYIVPQGQNRYMVGATHMESESEAPIYTKSVMSLLTGAVLYEPRFKDAYLIDTKVGLRPTTDNHLPFVRKSEGLFEINGLFRHGFLLAPAISASVAADLGASK